MCEPTPPSPTMRMEALVMRSIPDDDDDDDDEAVAVAVAVADEK